MGQVSKFEFQTTLNKGTTLLAVPCSLAAQEQYSVTMWLADNRIVSIRPLVEARSPLGMFEGSSPDGSAALPLPPLALYAGQVGIGIAVSPSNPYFFPLELPLAMAPQGAAVVMVEHLYEADVQCNGLLPLHRRNLLVRPPYHA